MFVWGISDYEQLFETLLSVFLLSFSSTSHTKRLLKKERGVLESLNDLICSSELKGFAGSAFNTFPCLHSTGSRGPGRKTSFLLLLTMIKVSSLMKTKPL